MDKRISLKLKLVQLWVILQNFALIYKLYGFSIWNLVCKRFWFEIGDSERRQLSKAYLCLPLLALQQFELECERVFDDWGSCGIGVYGLVRHLIYVFDLFLCQWIITILNLSFVSSGVNWGGPLTPPRDFEGSFESSITTSRSSPSVVVP